MVFQLSTVQTTFHLLFFSPHFVVCTLGIISKKSLLRPIKAFFFLNLPSQHIFYCYFFRQYSVLFEVMVSASRLSRYESQVYSMTVQSSKIYLISLYLRFPIFNMRIIVLVHRVLCVNEFPKQQLLVYLKHYNLASVMFPLLISEITSAITFVLLSYKYHF